MTQQEFWRGEVERLPLASRLAYIENQFPGSYGCGWDEGTFYPIPQEDAAILQALWEETFVALHGKAPDRGAGPWAK